MSDLNHMNAFENWVMVCEIYSTDTTTGAIYSTDTTSASHKSCAVSARAPTLKILRRRRFR